MTGTLINVAAILAGGAAGLFTKKELSSANQSLIKVGLGAFTVYLGLHLAWTGMDGGFGNRLKQLGLILLAMILGKFAGRLLRLQQHSNRLGHFAKERLAEAHRTHTAGDAFLTTTVLFCAGPIAFLGAVLDGLLGDPRTLIVKALIDGLAAMSFVKVLGWGVFLSVIPVMALQGTLTLLAKWSEPALSAHGLIGAAGATSGLLVFCVALIILELKRIELTDYLPSAVLAPLIGWFWWR